MRFLFLDTETTGLDPDRHEVIQLAVIEASIQPGPIGAAFSADRMWEAWFHPRRPGIADPQALKVNGYPQRWTGKVLADRPSALRMLLEDAKDAVLCGHNVSFDVGFLDAECHEESLPLLSRVASHRKLCTQSLAFMDVVTGQAPSAGLSALHAKYNLFHDPKEQHTALHDALASLRLANVYLARWDPTKQLNLPGIE